MSVRKRGNTGRGWRNGSIDDKTRGIRIGRKLHVKRLFATIPARNVHATYVRGCRESLLRDAVRDGLCPLGRRRVIRTDRSDI